MTQQLYNFQVKNIKGEDETLGQYKGKVLLIVNTASKCGFTGQYDGLQGLYEKYKDQGLEILGFPCNQFGGQEPDGEEQIQNFCSTKFNVTFPMFSKIDVNGKDADPLYEYLKEEAPGLLGSKAIKWNFTKFLINKEGTEIQRYAPKDTPQSLEQKIQSLL